jgi:hypothetical protein
MRILIKAKGSQESELKNRTKIKKIGEGRILNYFSSLLHKLYEVMFSLKKQNT